MKEQIMCNQSTKTSPTKHVLSPFYFVLFKPAPTSYVPVLLAGQIGREVSFNHAY